MKKITFCVPCYNEEDNVEAMALALKNQVENIGKYDYEIIFRNNASTDNTLQILRRISSKDNRIKVISNARNYGISPQKDTFRNRVSGDAIIFIACDFQEPPEMIPEFIEWWEKGYSVVAGQKIGSKEGKMKHRFRQFFYGIIDCFSEVPQVKNMSGITLISRKVAEMWWETSGQELRYFLSDLGVKIKLVPYVQATRAAGKSSYNARRYLSFAINSMVATSIFPLRFATVLGTLCSFISFIIGIIYFLLKIIWWDSFPVGTAPILIGIFFVSSVQLLFLGIVGEYVGVIHKNTSCHIPPVVDELINFDSVDEKYYIKNFESTNDKN